MELKAFRIALSEEGGFVGHVKYFRYCYDKSEADQYINKYKRIRCLDMARWCNEKWSNISTPYYKSVFYYEWCKRWLALADKFKEAK